MKIRSFSALIERERKTFGDVMNYRHTQFGWIMVICFAFAGAIIVGVACNLPPKPREAFPMFLVVAVLLASFLLFYDLTVEVNDEFIRLRFGIGLIRKKFRLADVVKCAPVRNRWWMGWGIHGWPGRNRGWLFNVSGWDAVELKLKSGVTYRIGTDEPQQLAEFIKAKLGKTI